MARPFPIAVRASKAKEPGPAASLESRLETLAAGVVLIADGRDGPIQAGIENHVERTFVS